MKKAPGDTIISHMYAINENHMMHGSWDTRLRECFPIFYHFLPFCLPRNSENQNFGKLKTTPGDIIIFPQVYHKWQSYDLWFLRSLLNCVPYLFTCSRANMPCLLCVPTCSRAITTNDKDKFSITCFSYILRLSFSCEIKTVVHSCISLISQKPLIGAMTNFIQ